MAEGKIIKELIQKNPVNKGLDYGFVDGVMRDAALRHFPELARVTSVRHIRHKRRVGKHNSTFIYTYVIRGEGSDGSPVQKQLVYSSHSDGSRLHAYHVLTALIASGFNGEGDFHRVMVPLEYLPEIQTLIYEAIPGKTLFEHMKMCRSPLELSDVVSVTADWIRKFHQFKLSDATLAKIPLFDAFNLNWKTDELLPMVEDADQHQAEKLRAFFETYPRDEKRLYGEQAPQLVYGDLHPENVLTTTLHPEGLTMIDFTDVARGDQMRDIGTFMQQLNFMGTQFYPEQPVNQLRMLFLERYFQQPVAALPITIIQRINLYQAWNSLRGFVYFFLQEKNRIRSYGLLEDAWRHLYNAQNDRPYFSITYQETRPLVKN